MKRAKWLVMFLALSVAISALVLGCGGGQKQPPAETPKEAEKPAEPATPAKPGVTRLTIASGWVVGVYYPIAGALSAIFNENIEGVKATVESSGASVANVKLIGSGDADLSIVQNDIAFYAANGQLMFQEKIPNIRGITRLYPEHVQMVALASSGIKSVADLKGKRVAVGPLGSGTEANTQQILEAYGLTFDDLGKVERLGAQESSDYLKDGRLDAAFYTTGVGAAAIADLAILKQITIIPVDEEHFKKMVEKYPFYSLDKVPAGAYKGVDQDVPTVAVSAILVGRAEIPEDMMYQMTKSIFDNLDLLESAHAKGKEITLETALDGMSIELHPGAKKYYQEKGIVK